MNLPPSPSPSVTAADEFELFFAGMQPRLQRALVATYGAERGREATAEALAWAWEHWDKARVLDNQIGYLYRVGQSRTRPRRALHLRGEPSSHDPWCEPGLARALAHLSSRQRTAVVLVHGFQWTLREVAEATGCRVTTVQNHLERGLARLRRSLETA